MTAVWACVWYLPSRRHRDWDSFRQAGGGKLEPSPNPVSNDMISLSDDFGLVHDIARAEVRVSFSAQRPNRLTHGRFLTLRDALSRNRREGL